MATLILDSLVLSSVTVRTVADATLGVRGEAKARSSGNRNSMRHPLPGQGLPKPRGGFAKGGEYPTPRQTPEAGWCRS
jgi:hypothetical protein